MKFSTAIFQAAQAEANVLLDVEYLIPECKDEDSTSREEIIRK